MKVVLVVEDDPSMRRFLRNSLQPAGYRVIDASNGAEGLALATQHVPDLVLLDLGLPDGDGLHVLTTLRGWMQSPILVISARDDERQKVAALDAGADDYLTKPFGFAELLARLRVALRHTSARDTIDAAAPLVHGPLRIDVAARSVTVEGEEVHLSPIEFALLLHLARHAGKVLTHQQLLAAVWGPRGAGQAHYLRVYMTNLRRKLETDDRRLFVTEPGVGYRLRASA
jgi:two-component system KDP operon response regulator KdpE